MPPHCWPRAIVYAERRLPERSYSINRFQPSPPVPGIEDDYKLFGTGIELPGEVDALFTLGRK